MQILQWATLYVDKDTITEKNYFNATLVGKKKFLASAKDSWSRPSDVSLGNFWSLTDVYSLNFNLKLEWDRWR